jgi:hypothetical protein
MKLNPVVGDVMLVAKLDRLLQRHIDLRGVRRPVNRPRSPPGSICQHYNPDNNNPGMGVRAFRKKLGHRNMDSFFAKESQMQAIGDACNSLPVQQGGCYEPVSRLSAQSAILIDVLLRDGHFAPDAEGAAGDF